MIKENKTLTTNNKNINEKLNEADSKKSNLEKAVRTTKDEATDLKADIEKLKRWNWSFRRIFKNK